MDNKLNIDYCVIPCFQETVMFAVYDNDGNMISEEFDERSEACYKRLELYKSYSGYLAVWSTSSDI